MDDIGQIIKDLAALVIDMDLRIKELDERHQLQIDELESRLGTIEPQKPIPK